MQTDSGGSAFVFIMERQIHPAQTKISEAAFQESDRIHPVTSNDEDNGSLQEAQQHPAQRRSCRDFKNIVRVGVIGAVLLIVVAVTVDAFTDKRLETAFSSFVDWVAHHPVRGTFAVILVYIAATVCFVPGSVLTVATGYAFGQAFPRHTFWAVILSSVAVFLGASVGSLMCLLLGRYLFREPVMRLAERYPIFRAVDRGTSLERKTILSLSNNPLT